MEEPWAYFTRYYFNHNFRGFRCNSTLSSLKLNREDRKMGTRELKTTEGSLKVYCKIRGDSEDSKHNEGSGIAKTVNRCHKKKRVRGDVIQTQNILNIQETLFPLSHNTRPNEFQLKNERKFKTTVKENAFHITHT